VDCKEKLGACAVRSVSRLLSEHVRARPQWVRSLLRDLRIEGYGSHRWQHLKRLIADPLVECIVSSNRECFNGCLEEVYIGDLTGGEHSYVEGHGGRDLDIIIKLRTGCKHAVEEDVEKVLEDAVSIVLEEVFGVDFHRLLGIPNIIEVHIVDGPDAFPYYQMIESSSPCLVKVWPKERGGAGETC